jgi:hypothetical protein
MQSFFERRDGLGLLAWMTRAGADVREADLLQDLADRALVIDVPEPLLNDALEIDPRQRTTPSTARSGPVSTISARAASCTADKRGGFPFDQLSFKPSGPCVLNRWTQSRSV